MDNDDHNSRFADYPRHSLYIGELNRVNGYPITASVAQRRALNGTLGDLMFATAGPQQPAPIPALLPYEIWTFEPGVDVSSGQDGFSMNLNRRSPGSTAFVWFEPPGKKSFRVNVARNGGQTFMVKEEMAGDRASSGRYVEFFKRSPRMDLRFLSTEDSRDGFGHLILETANLLPEGAAEVDLGYWYEEDRVTGLQWHEFKVTWPGGPPDGEEETFHFSWKQRSRADLENGIDYEYVLEVTESPGDMLPPGSIQDFSCKLRKGSRPRQKVELQVTKGILGVQRQPAGVDRIWENMRWAAIVWSASYIYGSLDRSLNDRLGVVPFAS